MSEQENDLRSVDYVYHYTPMLNPALANLLLPTAGMEPPQMNNACELGFGQGVSICVHAAGSLTTWHGTDFNQQHVSFAQDMARASGIDIRVYGQSFAEFCARTDLPDFDYICMHGVWTWIDDAARSQIVDFVRRKLKPGGVFYVSYNVQAGWGAFMPLHELLVHYSENVSEPDKHIHQRVTESFKFMEGLLDNDPLYTRNNPIALDRCRSLNNKPMPYVAHEFFAIDWQPMSFLQIAKWLRPAGLEYACQASGLALSAASAAKLVKGKHKSKRQKFLDAIKDKYFCEAVNDIFSNTMFRIDYWVKEPRHLLPEQRAAHLRSQNFLSIRPIPDMVEDKVEKEWRFPAGFLPNGIDQAQLWMSLKEVLSKQQIVTVAEVEEGLQDKFAGVEVGLDQLIYALLSLDGKGMLKHVQDASVVNAVVEKASRFNDDQCQRAYKGTPEFNMLVSPLTGEGFYVDRFDKLFLHAHQSRQPRENWSKTVWRVIEQEGGQLSKGKRKLQGEQEHLDALEKMADRFVNVVLPTLRVMRIAD